MWLRHLPGESALVRRGVLSTEWSRQEHFAISTIDMLKVNGHHAWLIAGAPDMPDPEFADRPEWVSDPEFDALTEMVRRTRTMKGVGDV